MNKYKELVRSLRECVNGGDCNDCEYGAKTSCRLELNNDAADAIEELLGKLQQSAENNIALIDEIENMRRNAPCWRKRNERESTTSEMA